MRKTRWIGLACSLLLLAGCACENSGAPAGASESSSEEATATSSASGDARPAPSPSRPDTGGERPEPATPTEEPPATTEAPPAPESEPEPAPPEPAQALATDLSGMNIGYIHGYEPEDDAITVDVVYFLSEPEAIAYAETHPAYQQEFWCTVDGSTQVAWGTPGSTCTVPNGYMIINENPSLRRLSLTWGTSISLIDWDNCCDLQPSNRSVMTLRIAQGPILAWFNVGGDGYITSIEEQFVP
jgi:hypothetical protein